MSLNALGFDSRFAFSYEEAAASIRVPHHPARVVRADRGRVVVHDGSDARSLPLTGRFIHEPPVVGDFVGVETDTGRLLFVIERRQLLARRRAGTEADSQPLVANVDVVWLAAPADRFNLSWVERGVRLARDSGAKPVVLVTKADLLGGRDVERELFDRHIYEDVVLTRVDEPSGHSRLVDSLASGQTAVLIGPSGAGKSTLLNALLGEETVATGAVRDGDRKGRHTTVRRELHVLPSGGLIIDTPGTRELGLTAARAGEGSGFDDIDELSSSCRFDDCRHEHEPGCAVVAAVDSDELPDGPIRAFFASSGSCVTSRRSSPIRTTSAANANGDSPRSSRAPSA